MRQRMNNKPTSTEIYKINRINHLSGTSYAFLCQKLTAWYLGRGLIGHGPLSPPRYFESTKTHRPYLSIAPYLPQRMTERKHDRKMRTSDFSWRVVVNCVGQVRMASLRRLSLPKVLYFSNNILLVEERPFNAAHITELLPNVSRTVITYVVLSSGYPSRPHQYGVV